MFCKLVIKVYFFIIFIDVFFNKFHMAFKTYNNRLAILIFVVTLFVGIHCSAQLQNNHIDSIILAIQKEPSDSDKISKLVNYSKSLKCVDSTYKIQIGRLALELANKIGWKKGVVISSFDIANCYADCMHRPEANKYFQLGIDAARDSRDTPAIALGLVLMAQAYGELNLFAKKIDCYQEVLSLKTPPQRKTGVYSNMGSAYANIGDYSIAMTCYDSALHILDEFIKSEKKPTSLDTQSKAVLRLAIGDIYLTIRDFEKALRNYQNALLLFELTKKNEARVNVLTSIGKTYQAMGSYDLGISNFKKALEICKLEEKESNFDIKKQIIFDQLGRYFFDRGHTDSAFFYANSSLLLIERNPESSELPVTYTLLGELYAKTGKFDKAIHFLNGAIAFCKKSGALEIEKDALFALSNLYGQMNQPAKALDVYKNYIAVRDSVFSLDKAKEITRHDMNAAFEEKQAAQKAEQEKENAIQKTVMELTLKRQHFAYLVFTVIIILLVIVGILFYTRSKLREKLEMQMAITSERTRISSEMHDDMGSELSKISLLSEIVKQNVKEQNSESHLINISRSSKELLDRLGEIVWSLNDKYDKLDNLIIYIRRFAMEFFNSTDIDCKVITPEHVPDLPIDGEMRRSVFLLVKEALHNALKHSKADLVTVTITIIDQYINIVVADNGIGIDEHALSEFGNGLDNMKKRVADLKGSIDFATTNGVTITFKFPLPVTGTTHKWL